MANNKDLYGNIFTKLNLSFDDWFVDIENYQSENSIYKSTNVVIDKVIEKKTGQILIAKIYKIDMNKITTVEKSKLQRLLLFMSKLNHPSIIKLIGFSPINFQNQLNPVIIEEMASYGSLFDLLKNEKKNKNHNSNWNTTKKLTTIYGIASAMKYLHSQSILHRNLSPSNILLDSSFHPKLSNFEFFKEATEKEDFELFGEPQYVAPEVWMRKEYSQASDVYAFAFIVYQILTNEEIFKGQNVSKIMNEVVNKKNRPLFKSPIASCYKSLIQSCWADDPSKRPSFVAIVDKMKTDSSFILDDANKEEYFEYIKIVDNECYESQRNEGNKEKIIKENKDEKIDSNNDDIIEISEKNFFDIDKYEKLKEINRGTSVTIFSIKDKETGKLFAAKVSKKEIKEFSDENKKQLFRDNNIMSKINHPAIVKFIGISIVDFSNKPKFTIITDLMKGSLRDLFKLERKGKAPLEWNNTKKLIMVFGIACGMLYLHSYKVLHHDLKPENILINEYLHPKICDFQLMNGNMCQNIVFVNGKNEYGTLIYMAPELINDDSYYEESDVYSFSLIFYEIITGNTPFEIKSIHYFIRKIMQGERPKFDSKTPTCLKDLISNCWDQNYKNRPSFSTIVGYLKKLEKYSEFLNNDEEQIKEYLEYINHVENCSKNEICKHLFTKVNIDFDLKENFESNEEISNKFDYQLIDLDKYEKKEKLGYGSFANVYRVIEKETSNVYAAKILNTELCDLSQKEQYNFSRELQILSKLHYESIMKFIGYSPKNFKEKSKPVFIVEMESNGSLNEILELERKGCAVPNWNETKKLINIFGIACGMKYMHSISIIHRDLKPENILLDDNIFPKISDFGLSKDIKGDKHFTDFPLGTPRYIAPEIWDDGEYTEAVDVYAFSMIMYEIVTGEKPLIEFKSKEQIFINIMVRKYHPTFKYKIPDCYRNLIEMCWSYDPAKRPTFSKIVSMLKEDPGFLDGVDLDEFIDYTELIGEFYENKRNENQQNQQKQNEELREKATMKKDETKNKNSLIIKKETNKTMKQIETNNNIYHDLSLYEQKDIISKEEFAKTIKIVEKETNNSFAARIFNIDINQFNQEEMNQISKEINDFSMLNHPSVLKIIGFSPFSFKKEQKPVIITELPSRKTLRDILEIKRNRIHLTDWNSTKNLICIYGIASAMKYLHSHEIVHRQLMPKNILIDHNFHPKVQNFGQSTYIINLTSMASQSLSRVHDTHIYSAPEILNFEECTKASDVYSFSFILYEILTNEKPLNDLNDFSIIYKD